MSKLLYLLDFADFLGGFLPYADLAYLAKGEKLKTNGSWVIL